MTERSNGMTEYLASHQEDSSETSRTQAKKHESDLTVPFEKTPYDPYVIRTREADVRHGDIRLRYTYDVASQSGTDQYQRYWPQPPLFFLQELSILRVIDRDKRKFVGKSLTEIAPDCKVFFDPSERAISSAVSSAGLICVGKDITSPAGLLILAHEAGHVIRYRQLPRQERLESIKLSRKYGRDKTMTQEERERIIRDEREAWATGLRNIRGLLGNKHKSGGLCSIEDARRLIHDLSLASHFNAVMAQEISSVATDDELEA